MGNTPAFIARHELRAMRDARVTACRAVPRSVPELSDVQNRIGMRTTEPHLTERRVRGSCAAHRKALPCVFGELGPEHLRIEVQMVKIDGTGRSPSQVVQRLGNLATADRFIATVDLCVSLLKQTCPELLPASLDRAATRERKGTLER